MAQDTRKKKPNKPESYQKLKVYWYKKLAKSGFRDIERDGPKYKIESYDTQFNTQEAARTWYAKSEYYSMARRFLHDYKFKSNLEKVIWEYHSEGISYRNIAKLLKNVKIMIPNKDNVNNIVKRLIVEMKKMYLVGYE